MRLSNVYNSSIYTLHIVQVILVKCLQWWALWLLEEIDSPAIISTRALSFIYSLDQRKLKTKMNDYKNNTANRLSLYCPRGNGNMHHCVLAGRRERPNKVASSHLEMLISCTLELIHLSTTNRILPWQAKKIISFYACPSREKYKQQRKICS